MARGRTQRTATVGVTEHRLIRLSTAEIFQFDPSKGSTMPCRAIEFCIQNWDGDFKYH